MTTFIEIMKILGPLLEQLSAIVAQAVAANATKDQTTLDRLHDQARALADSLKPAGA